MDIELGCKFGLAGDEFSEYAAAGVVHRGDKGHEQD